MVLLGDEEKRFSAVRTAGLNANGFCAALLDHRRVVLNGRVAAVGTTDFSHFVSSLRIIERPGRLAGRGWRR